MMPFNDLACTIEAASHSDEQPLSTAAGRARAGFDKLSYAILLPGKSACG
jgi:hypothetical protein